MGRTSSGTILLAFVAILCGLLGTYAFRQLTRSRPVARVTEEAPEQIVVPMASTDLPAGRKVTMGDIAIIRMTREQMKQRDVRSPFMTNTNQIIGRTLQQDLQRGETFDTSQFYPEGLGPGVAEELGPGERAVTVSIRNENGLIGFAGAGQVVDVLFHAKGEAGAGSLRRNTRSWGRRYADQLNATSTLMQGVRVLALGNDTFAPVGQASGRSRERLWVTLAVSPAQAEILRVVEGHGELSLTLRNPTDGETVELEPRRTLRDVLELPEIKSNEMEVYRGQRVNRIFFDRTTSISHRVDRYPVTSDDVPAGPQFQLNVESAAPRQAQSAAALVR